MASIISVTQQTTGLVVCNSASASLDCDLATFYSQKRHKVYVFDNANLHPHKFEMAQLMRGPTMTRVSTTNQIVHNLNAGATPHHNNSEVYDDSSRCYDLGDMCSTSAAEPLVGVGADDEIATSPASINKHCDKYKAETCPRIIEEMAVMRETLEANCVHGSSSDPYYEIHDDIDPTKAVIRLPYDYALPMSFWKNKHGHAYSIALNTEYIPLCFDLDYQCDGIRDGCVQMEKRLPDNKSPNAILNSALKLLTSFIQVVLEPVCKPLITKNASLPADEAQKINYSIMERKAEHKRFNLHVYFDFSVSAMLYCWLMDKLQEQFLGHRYKVDPITMLGMPFSAKCDGRMYEAYEKPVSAGDEFELNTQWSFPNFTRVVDAVYKVRSNVPHHLDNTFCLGKFFRMQQSVKWNTIVCYTARDSSKDLYLVCPTKATYIKDTPGFPVPQVTYGDANISHSAIRQFGRLVNCKYGLLERLYSPSPQIKFQFKVSPETLLQRTIVDIFTRNAGGVAKPPPPPSTTTSAVAVPPPPKRPIRMGNDHHIFDVCKHLEQTRDYTESLTQTQRNERLTAQITDVVGYLVDVLKYLQGAAYHNYVFDPKLVLQLLSIEGSSYTVYLMMAVIRLLHDLMQAVDPPCDINQIRSYVTVYLITLVNAVSPMTPEMKQLLCMLRRLNAFDYEIMLGDDHKAQDWLDYLKDTYAILVQDKQKNKKRKYTYFSVELRSTTTWTKASVVASVKRYAHYVTKPYRENATTQWAFKRKKRVYVTIDEKSSFLLSKVRRYIAYLETFDQFKASNMSLSPTAIVGEFYCDADLQPPLENYYKYLINTKLGVFNTITGTYMAPVPLLYFVNRKEHCVGYFDKRPSKCDTMLATNESATDDFKRTVDVWKWYRVHIEDMFYTQLLVPGLMHLQYSTSNQAFESNFIQILRKIEYPSNDTIWKNIYYMHTVFLQFPKKPLSCIIIGEAYYKAHRQPGHPTRFLTDIYKRTAHKLNKADRDLMTEDDSSIVFKDDENFIAQLFEIQKMNPNRLLGDTAYVTGAFCMGYILSVVHSEMYVRSQPYTTAIASGGDVDVFRKSHIVCDSLTRPHPAARIRPHETNTKYILPDDITETEYLRRTCNEFTLYSPNVRNVWQTNVYGEHRKLRFNQMRSFSVLTRHHPLVHNMDAAMQDLLFQYARIFSFNTEAVCEFFQHLSAIFNPTADRKFLIMMVGVSKSGKSTLQNVMRTIHGNNSYSATSIGGSGSGGNKPSPDLTSILSNYYAQFTECERLDNATIKVLTGGDTITARTLYKAPKSYKCVSTILVACNQVPKIMGDLGTMSRLAMFKFGHAYKKMNESRNALTVFMNSVILMNDAPVPIERLGETMSNVLYAVYASHRIANGQYEPNQVRNPISVELVQSFWKHNSEVMRTLALLNVTIDPRFSITEETLTILCDKAIKNGEKLEPEFSTRRFIAQFALMFSTYCYNGVYTGVGQMDVIIRPHFTVSLRPTPVGEPNSILTLPAIYQNIDGMTLEPQRVIGELIEANRATYNEEGQYFHNMSVLLVPKT